MSVGHSSIKCYLTIHQASLCCFQKVKSSIRPRHFARAEQWYSIATQNETPIALQPRKHKQWQITGGVALNS